MLKRAPRFAACDDNNKVVGIIAPFPPPYGGMSVQADRLVSGLQREGCKVCIIPTNPLPPHGLRWVQVIPGLRTLIREIQYLLLLVRGLPRCDLVHHFSASGFYFFAQSAPVLFLGRILKKKVVLNYRGGDAPVFLARWHWRIVTLLRCADTVAVPSEFLQLTFLKYGLLAVLLPNIADTDSFIWKDRPWFTPKLLVTRRLERMYNVECVLRAFRIVKHVYPDALLTIAGDGPDEQRLRELATVWNLPGVRFCGAVAHGELPALYSAHDIYVNASSVDNFPGALMEAACCGLPIVTTRAGGIPCMIRDRHNGILVDLNDCEALAAGVVEFIEKPELGQACALNARSWVEQFSWPHVWARLRECYGFTTKKTTSVSAYTETDLRKTTRIGHGELVR